MNKLEFSDIERCFNEIEIFQQLILNAEFNLAVINIENKRSEYLENVINSLKKIINNLSNPYNFNLWRKLSNIILKNIFVILHNKNFTFTQNYSKSVLNQLYKYTDKLKDIEKESILVQVKEYKNHLDTQKKACESTGTSAADNDRNYNLIIVENNINYSLSIDFLFFLKEKGNKVNHLDQEVIDFILFDDLNIEEIKKKESFDKEKDNIEEGINVNQTSEKNYERKVTFNADELIEMLKNPLKFQKKEIDINKICFYIYNKISEIKKKFGLTENEKKLNELKNKTIELQNKIDKLISTYEKYFSENNINFKENQTNKILENSVLESLSQYNKLLELKSKNNKKKELFENIEKDLTSLNDITTKGVDEINQLITNVKNGNNNEKKLISLYDIFDEFKKDLKEKIKFEEEYKQYSSIFNENNINNFKIEDLFNFLNEKLNYPYTSYSIT